MNVLRKEKVVLLGDEGVGKTSLVRRFVQDEFDDRYVSTIGTKVSKQTLHIDGNEQVLQIWDVFGQHGYNRVQAACYCGSTGAIVVIDLTRPETLWSVVRYWLPMLDRQTGELPIILFANKADLDADELFRHFEIDKLLHDRIRAIFLTSAKTGFNVDFGFTQLGRAMLLHGNPRRSQGINSQTPGRVSTPVEAADLIMDEFCRDFGDRVHAMSIIRQQFIIAGVDIRDVTVEGLIRVTELLLEVETSFMGRRKAERKMEARLELIKGVCVAGA